VVWSKVRVVSPEGGKEYGGKDFLEQVGFKPGVNERGVMDEESDEATEEEVTGAGKGEPEIEKSVRG